MTGNQLVAPEYREGTDEDLWRQLQQTYGLLTGQGNWGVDVTLRESISVSGSALFGGDVQLGDEPDDGISVNGTSTFGAPATFNADTLFAATATFTAAVNLGDGPDDVITVGGTSTFTAPMTVNAQATFTAGVRLGDDAADAIQVDGTSTFSAPATFQAAVTLGDAAADTLTVNATSTFAAPATFNDAVTLGDAASDALTVNATSTFVGEAAFHASVSIGNAAADALYVAATSTFFSALTVRNVGGTVAPLSADPATGRVIVGSLVPIAGALEDRFTVIGGRAYVQARSETIAVGLRYGPASGMVGLGVSSALVPDLVLTNNDDVQLGRVLGAGGLIVGEATAMLDDERLLVEGGVTIAPESDAVTITHVNALTDTSAGAGSLAALPGPPALWIWESVNGSLYRRPLWN